MKDKMSILVFIVVLIVTLSFLPSTNNKSLDIKEEIELNLADESTSVDPSLYYATDGLGREIPATTAIPHPPSLISSSFAS